MNLILFNSLKACGDVNRPVIASLVLTFGIALPAAYIAVVVWELGLPDLWYVYIFEEGLKAGVMLTMWRGRRWAQIKLSEP